MIEIGTAEAKSSLGLFAEEIPLVLFVPALVTLGLAPTEAKHNDLFRFTTMGRGRQSDPCRFVNARTP